MLLPLGILASSGGAAAADYELISTTVLSSTQAQIDFALSSFSATYKHLQLRVAGRTTEAVADSNMSIRFNNDTGSNYFRHVLYGNGSSAVSSGLANASSITSAEMVGASGTTNAFGAAIVDLLDPFSTSKNKTIRSLSGFAQSANFVSLRSGAWNSTSAVTTLNVYATSGSFVSGTRLSLYGLKG